MWIWFVIIAVCAGMLGYLIGLADERSIKKVIRDDYIVGSLVYTNLETQEVCVQFDSQEAMDKLPTIPIAILRVKVPEPPQD